LELYIFSRYLPYLGPLLSGYFDIAYISLYIPLSLA